VIAIDLESDPVASGWIGSLSRPGGNVTGVFLDFPDFGAKCLQLLIESAPALAGIGVLWDPTTGSLQLEAVETAARGMNINVRIFEGGYHRRLLCAQPYAHPGRAGAVIAAIRWQPTIGRRPCHS
jgi:hypothetical protein